MSDETIRNAENAFSEVTKPTHLKSSGKNLAYIRVSTEEQNDERQRAAITERLARENDEINKWFAEKVSAKDDNRPELQSMLEFAREGDTVYVHDFSRLARNVEDLLHIVQTLNTKDVRLVSNKENIDTTEPIGKFLLTILGAVYEFERAIMLERQREGIEIAKKNDEGKDWKDRKYKGRQPFEKRKKFDKSKFERLYQRYLTRDISKSEFARQIGASRPTLDRLLAQRKAEGEV